MNIITKLKEHKKYLTLVVWLLRILVGATFAMSGFVKAIDLWGFTFKIEEYFLAWDMSLPHSLYVMAALAMSVGEFILGAMLLIGSYRKSTPWLLLSVMALMLPLSLYIFIANPVADCGCFGDFWVLSNGATFFKNIIITAAIVLLIPLNKQVKGVFNPYTQWLPAVATIFYIVAIALFGYNVQPLIDFRSFPVGTNFSDELSDDRDVEPQFEFIYQKDGIEEAFSMDNLPDSSWTFVERKLVSGSVDNKTELTLYEDGEDVTEDVLSTEGPLMLIVISDHRRVNISYTYAINELHHCLDSVGGTFVEVVAMPEEKLKNWRDLSMANYPIYRAEATVLKELARGPVAAVYIVDGEIRWKISLQALDVDRIVSSKDKNSALEASYSKRNLLIKGTFVLFILYCAAFILEKSRLLAKWMAKRKSISRQSEKK